MASLQAIGIFGGTFDPVHFGHLRLAQEALEQCRLREVRFIPSGTPPHRTPPQASAEQRLHMVQLAIQGQPGFVLDSREAHRTDKCFTVDTLAALRAELGAMQPLCLLLGSDAFLQLHTWHEWRQLFELAHIAVMQRPGRPLGNAILQADEELQQQYRNRLAPSTGLLHESASGQIAVLDMPLLDISATDIRKRAAQHKNLRYLLPDAVVQYINMNHLYQTC
ncbi:MAG TPA: nicotinate-nucleotide adenylyltransferase [Pseudomonadales bacterium]